LVTIEHVTKFGDDRPSDLGDQAAKKEDLNYSGKTEWATDAGGRP